MAAITTNGLSRRFGRTQALDGVTVEIGTGEMVALIGASGSGKSTLIRHVAGLERADAGRVEVLGRTGQEGGRMLSRPDGSIAVLFQQFNLVGRMSVLMNVLMGHLGRAPRLRGTLGLFTAEEKAAGLAALSRVGIGQVAGQRASTL